MNLKSNSHRILATRMHLLTALAEAAELEHGLMCMYLYALFSLKQSEAEGLTAEELRVVTGWRKDILNICIQEMGHLALVTNLTTALGGGAHFSKPAFPIRPGHFPSDFVLELAPFNLETLQHFIFLERPEDAPVEDSAACKIENEVRSNRGLKLMRHAGKYKTVGELYDIIADTAKELNSTLGGEKLFCGSRELQITPAQLKLDGVIEITNLESALTAIAFVVEQGEGSRQHAGSHFEKFSAIKVEYEKCLEKNSRFIPGRAVVKNPLLTQPSAKNEGIWIDNNETLHYIDLANSLYSLMLRHLLQYYSFTGRSEPERKRVLITALSLMKCISLASNLVTTSPALSDLNDKQRAGMTFDIEKYFVAFDREIEQVLISEHAEAIAERFAELQNSEVNSEKLAVLNQLTSRFNDILATN